jgi:delta14-sterol reductase
MDDILQSVNIFRLLYATLIFVGFIVIMFVATKFLPGIRCQGGSLQADGTPKSYKLNGLILFITTTFVVAGGTLLFDLSLAPLHKYFWYLFIVANLFAFTWTVILYIVGKRAQEADTEPTLTKIFSDLWFGIELNPTWLGVDLKLFAYQPSLIGLGLLNASFAYVQYETYGQVSLQMLMFQTFWWVYLASHYYFEECTLSMWDIIAEKFGFMLIWGDLVLVPFFYSIIGWFLVDKISPIPLAAIIGICLLYIFGLWLFRESNLQKHRFKKNPNINIWGQPAQSLKGKLLISGWWGIGRKLNYSGEICLYLAIALTTGFNSIIPYLLPLWLCLLLIHRAGRDEQRCRAKYGELWGKYCAKARFRLVPFLY